MHKPLATLIAGIHAQSKDRIRDAFTIELIDQKIRAAERSLRTAKTQLATLSQQHENQIDPAPAMGDKTDPRDTCIQDLRRAIDAAHKRLVDLRQGAIRARALRRDQQIGAYFDTAPNDAPIPNDTDELIARILGHDDPLENTGLLGQTDA